MYEELVKDLRYLAKVYSICENESTKEYSLAVKAADAIEAMNRSIDALEADNERLCEQIDELSMKLHGDEAAIVGMKREIERMVVAGKPRWIPVTERPPEADGSFITAYSKGGVSQNWYMTFHHGGGKWYQNSEDSGEVTHWMPLPEPPKEEANV